MGSHAGRTVGSDASVREVMNGLRRLIRVLRLSDAEVERRIGISSAQLFVLAELGAAPGCSVGEVARRTHTDQSSVSMVVTRLVARGLVARTESAEDRRRVELRVTPKGRALLRRAPGTTQSRLVAGVAGLPPARRRALARVLGELVQGIGGDAEAPTMFFEEGARGTRRGTR